MKMRLMGLPEELTKAVEVIEGVPAFDIRSISEHYQNRGKTKECRAYIEFDLNQTPPKRGRARRP